MNLRVRFNRWSLRISAADRLAALPIRVQVLELVVTSHAPPFDVGNRVGEAIMGHDPVVNELEQCLGGGGLVRSDVGEARRCGKPDANHVGGINRRKVHFVLSSALVLDVKKE